MTEKDDVHWITGQELREIYADDLSLDKYDEIRKRPASQNSGLYEPVGQKPDPCLVCPIWLKGSHQCDGNPCGSKVEYARKEHDRAIEQAAREDEQRKWRDDHPADLVWMTSEEEEARIRRDERERFANALKDDVNCGRGARDQTQCGYCPYRRVMDNGDYGCSIDDAVESLRSEVKKE
jgi:hypothetical protein